MTMFHLNIVSGNKKTGPIPVSTSAMDTCPSTCPLKDAGCYADLGPLGLHWRKVSNGENKKAVDATDFLNQVKAMPRHKLWRHNQAGDLVHENGYIDSGFLKGLVKANRGKRGFTYTHHLTDIGENKALIKYANDNGFTVNLSANSKFEAVKMMGDGLPVVTVLAADAPNVETIEGVKVVACPAEKSDRINCESCGLCAISSRDYIIGFRAHGIRKKKAELITKG